MNKSIYNDLKKFINKADERIFNDRLMVLTCVEISLKSKSIDGEIILPTYRNRGVWYGGGILSVFGSNKNTNAKKSI